MSRPSTAVRQWEVPGRAGRPVRLHRPGAARDGGRKSSWRVTYSDDGKQRETTAVGETSAVAKAEAIVARLAAKAAAARADRTVAELVDAYMTWFADKKQWGPTYRAERAHAVRWLPPWLLALECRDWTVRESERVLAAVAAAGSPRGTQEYRRVGALLSGLRTAGRHYGFLPAGADPMIGVAYNAAPRQRQERPDRRPEKFANIRPVADTEIPPDDAIDELADVAHWLTGDWREALRIRLLRGSGLRWGEHADLRVGQLSLDPANPFVHVCRQSLEVPARFSGGRGTLFRDMPPKNRMDRHAFYDPALCDALERLIAGIRRGRPHDLQSELLLPARRGGVRREGNYLARVWGPAAAACGWQRVEDLVPRPPGSKRTGWQWTPHSLRHRYATWLVREVKADLYDVSEWMGHSDTAVTRRMYVSHSEPNVRAGVRAVAALRAT